MSSLRLRVPHEVAAMLRVLHPDLKRRLRNGLEHVVAEPSAGKPLVGELQGLLSFRVGRFRIGGHASKMTTGARGFKTRIQTVPLPSKGLIPCVIQDDTILLG